MSILLFVLACWHIAQGADFKCYGDVSAITATGASYITANQNSLFGGGVATSYTLLDNDYAELNKRKSCYYQTGVSNCIQPSLIAALASRESKGGGSLYDTGGYGNGGHAYGILQCDSQTTTLDCDKYRWDSCQHINFMVKSLVIPRIEAVKRDHPTWTEDQILKGGISAYNAGSGSVQTIAGVDIGTDGNDYSNDVCARAQKLIAHYQWE